MRTAPTERRERMHVAHWLSDAVRRYPSATAVRDRSGAHTYRSLEADTHNVQRALQEAGLLAGDRVAVVGRNSALSIAIFFACARAGWVYVPLSFRLTSAELARALEWVDPAIVVVDNEFVDRLPVGANRVTQGALREESALLIIRGREPRRAPGRGLSDGAGLRSVDAALLMVATSGTSRAPKYAVLSHRQCWWANVMLADVFPIGPGDVVLGIMPQHHVGGWNAFTLRALQVGATLILPAGFREDDVLRSLEHDGVSAMMGVPTHYQRLAAHSSFDGRDLTGLTTALVGGAPTPFAVRRRWRSRGVVLREGYGLTEAGPHVLIEDAVSTASTQTTWFVPYPHVEVRITGLETDTVISGPGVGELAVRSPAVFTGYFRDDEATRRARPDGWLRTGDRVERDSHGRYRVIDRLNDIIISGGENVSPAEIESIIATHRDVRDVVVMGVADERWGEVPVALVVWAADASVDVAQELRALCREHLAAFKVPAHVHVIDALPRTELGKARRSAARAMFDAARAAGSVGATTQ